MQGFLRIAVVASAAIGLSACSTVRLLTFNAHEQSKPVAGSAVLVSAEWICSEEAFTEQVALATLAYNLLSSEVTGWAERKKAQFTKTYGGMVNIPPSSCAGNERLEVTIGRSVVNERQLSRLVFVAEPFNSDHSAWQLSAQSVDLRHAAALTSQKSASVDMTVTISISTVQPNDKNVPTFTKLTEQSLNLPAVALPSSGAIEHAPVSPLFPQLPADKPLNITVAVTETGTGGEDFGQLVKHVEANSDLIRGYLSEAIKD
ncbi:hypothetical protein A167_03282 [Alcanivorax sp. S71-1-4]|uniref:hypothetical protein n=1 Tax=Alcanivorax sp. S71-1-4 TaxID=1177159 RepID=UPI00135BCB14|nr:hypothetical protein [Alcanivorax sp. S71-1-4]KAF0806123.1 hypothetical protein A167_03282 [Alcanivorax sp. S71-1-4]